MNQPEDVEIVLSHQRRYKFHSGTLARNSTWFAEELNERNAAKLNHRARQAGIKLRWMVELAQLPDDYHPGGLLKLVDLTPTGEPVDGRAGLVINENGRLPQAEKVFHQYEMILYAFYNKPLVIDDSDMRLALQDCYQLLEISDYLGCTSLISKPIEVALFKHGQSLFQAIRVSPHAWMGMAYRIRSELIFKECMIHLAGDWRNIKQKANVVEQLRVIPGARSLVKKYHHALLDKAKDVETKVASHYPQSVRLPSEELPIKRESYARDILVWMALTFFRHWITQRILTGKGRDAPDCGFDLFTALGAGGNHYMDKTVMNQFHAKFPMTKKAMNVLENHLFELKECIKNVVLDSGILKSQCQLDVHRFPTKHLTCTEFDREDFPWLKEEKEAMALPTKRAYKPGGNEIARRNLETVRKFQNTLTGEDREEFEDDDDAAEDEEQEIGAHYRDSPSKRMRYN
ncbi:hypothetical protein E8E13_008969 [Curvularia kusanoi]|uniref:BTB domain-containing protein n=1 Tax=Curvularia kusanoi TaxID=90978 RepID=A0A9P4WEX6_CURKU|nr:hypothetical protein E8E13_008969 [Curvularia kusanoi]